MFASEEADALRLSGKTLKTERETQGHVRKGQNSIWISAVVKVKGLSTITTS